MTLRKNGQREQWKEDLLTFYKERYRFLLDNGISFVSICNKDIYEKKISNKVCNPILLVAEVPGKDEVDSGEPLTGESGENIAELIKISKLANSMFVKTNLFPFRTFTINANENRPPDSKEIEKGMLLLEHEISLVKPRLIISLGEIACYGIKKLQKLKPNLNHQYLIFL